MSKTNKIHAAVYTVLGIAIVILSILWYRSWSREKELRTAVNNSYDRAFFQLADYVTDIDALLSKAQLAASPAQMASISNEIFMQAAEAKSCFGELPSGNVNLENTARFLSQVGDYTYVLSQSMINGQGISAEEYENLNALNEYAASLSQSLGDIEQKIYQGDLSFSASDDTSAGSAVAASSIFTDLENVEKSFDGYPALIYDGPFSEHIENMQSYMLSSAPELTRDEALAKAKEFLGERGEGLQYETEMTNTAIEAYMFGKSDEDSHLTISITKRGGYVLYFLDSRSVTEQNYDVQSATEEAMRFLEDHGIYGLVDSYYDMSENIATINFAYSQNGVRCYSDLVKVRVALDTGEIVGMECKGYLMNHRERELGGAVLTQEEAQARVSSHLDVTATTMAVIPKDSMREVLCYEFKGTYMNKNFIVYINAENGREEEILLLIESENGILTI
ncbi:MAG TPA: germination protein YpeB [Candidatus Ornithomonoglobus merdipullorum]|uniref:Germination protein YpeB n=1 Tax=Candidatus Ornithomonoglobus merdipullorum TaxID=2840895 RepID=A0A9D1M9H0_9FIRM|nr:germination protein YpeB [Candidatus Ornithomonoglobus merdipullorum]